MLKFGALFGLVIIGDAEINLLSCRHCCCHGQFCQKNSTNVNATYYLRSQWAKVIQEPIVAALTFLQRHFVNVSNSKDKITQFVEKSRNIFFFKFFVHSKKIFHKTVFWNFRFSSKRKIISTRIFLETFIQIRIIDL